METLIRKYAAKLVSAGLAQPGDIALCALDDAAYWNDPAHAARPVLEEAMAGMNVSSLLFARPAEPYRSLIDFLGSRHPKGIMPGDCETRTFLHDLPVATDFTATALAGALKNRKCAILPGHGIVSTGSVGPEQAFVTFSSACFACFVLFFADYLVALRCGRADPDYRRAVRNAAALLPAQRPDPPRLATGPLITADAARAALIEAGRATVDYGLVDSYFGNISCRVGGTILVSQTGSSLDELEGCIDRCPEDGSSCAGITASSELSAHAAIYASDSGVSVILHGHPRFAVTLSLDCPKADCPKAGRCHLECVEPRFLADIPIVPGEVGTGPHGLCNTMPPAILGRRGAMVYGHGLFATGRSDFNQAFATLLDVESFCREEYFRRVAALGGL